MKEFNVYNITTWGLERDRRYGGFKLPLVFKNFPNERDEILGYCDKYEAKSPFYGSQYTLYFRLETITRKQANDILNQGNINIHIRFEFLGIEKNKSDENYLVFTVTGLTAIDNIYEKAPPEDL